MARKPRKQSKTLRSVGPRTVKGEIWAVGRIRLDIAVDDLVARNEAPEILLAIQDADPPSLIRVEPTSSAAPADALGNFIREAFKTPLQGKPRRPELIRVKSHDDANVLAVALSQTGISIEICGQLEVLDTLVAHLQDNLQGITNDYRTEAERAGSPLPDSGLVEFFRAAQQFYRQELWLSYDDDVMFEITLTPVQPGAEALTVYGILMGSMGEEFGLALFPTLDALERFYAISAEHLEDMQAPPNPEDLEQLQRHAETTAEFMDVPCVSLTFTDQADVPPPLLEEAHELKLPQANQMAFPLLLRTAPGHMQMATTSEMSVMSSALRAIHNWETQIDQQDVDTEFDVTITSKLRAVPEFKPAITARITLRLNPFAAQPELDDVGAEMASFFENLFSEPAPSKPASRSKKAASKGASKRTNASAERIYTLVVHLAQGPIEEDYEDIEISRHIEIRGNQTLHDLHRVIFKAFERWEQHLYEFNLGTGTADRSKVYFYSGGWNDDDSDNAGDPETTVLDALDLKVGQHFGYLFDMGDSWFHVIEVTNIRETGGKGTYPRVVKAVGPAPPQYPEDDEDVPF